MGRSFVVLLVQIVCDNLLKVSNGVQVIMMQRLPPTVRLIGIGWYFAVCIVGGLAGGYGLDYVAGTGPLLTMLGLFLGIALALYGGYRMIMEAIGTGMDNASKDTRK
jgi:Putative F0F1-ATPase subunit Ca2+/Mg2+ transporter